jgi:enamine deaminase RidA (YjgF/YER057c/UK114 family)
MAAGSTPEERLASMGLSVPEVAKPVAVYVPAVRTGDHVFTSGQLPMRSGELITTGKVGGEVTAEEAYACAQQCALNAIAAVKAEVGDLALVARVVKVVVFVASTPDFTGQPGVANGASELLGEVFGDAGVHARSAVGVPVLPLDSPVEIEIVVEVASGAGA